MEANYLSGVGDLGGDGPGKGAAQLAGKCGGATNLMKKLNDIYQASLTVLNNRANDKSSGSTNFLISNHYPGFCNNWYNTIKSARPNVNVKCVWGHVHSVSGGGDNVQSGGGGGCCLPAGDGTLGFYVYGFTDEPKIINIGSCVANFNNNERKSPWSGKGCPP